MISRGTDYGPGVWLRMGFTDRNTKGKTQVYTLVVTEERDLPVTYRVLGIPHKSPSLSVIEYHRVKVKYPSTHDPSDSWGLGWKGFT